MPLLLADIIYQMTCHWNLCSRFLAQTHANRIADAISQEGTDAYGTLDSAILAFAGFGYTEVERIIHTFLLHFFNQEAHRADHDNGIG